MGIGIGNQLDNRLLEARARLEFHYPGDEGIIILMPFYENPEISESQAANYVDYNPIARAGSLYAYTGAKSRKIKLKIPYTLPHLANFDMGIDRFQRIYNGQSKESQQNLFTNFKRPKQQRTAEGQCTLAQEVERLYWKARIDNGGRNVSRTLLDDNAALDASKLSERSFTGSGRNRILKHYGLDAEDVLGTLNNKGSWKVIDTVLFFTALVRTSVSNKVVNPLYGPPIIRLTFGTMYQSVPCICKNFNIKWEEEAGYHLETLTPRRLLLDLSLEEVRVGDFGKYDPAQYAARDNLTGWESAINSPYTTDPLPFTGV